MLRLRSSLRHISQFHTPKWFATTARIFRNMTPSITLTKEELRLRGLLLDVSEYIGSETEDTRPQLRFAGGWVRDKLLGTGSQDIDIAVSNMTGLRFAEYMREFAANSKKAGQYGEDIAKKITKIAARPEQSKHLETATLTVFGLSIDIANLRKEVYDDVTRNPQMEFGTAEEDALRRDATINALFYNLQDENVEDLTKQGIADMQEKIIRTPLDAYQTFKDDPLRILRCIRFASRLDYKIEESAVQAMAIPEIREALRVKITRERIGVEMEKIFKGPRVAQAFWYIENANLYPVIFCNPAWPEIRAVDLSGWRLVYLEVDKLLNGIEDVILCNLKNSFIITKEDQQITWIATALMPYSPLVWKEDYQPGKKEPKTLPALVAREGLKAENKIRDTIDAGFSRINQIVELKKAVQEPVSTMTSVTNGDIGEHSIRLTREEVGMVLCDWGASWKISIIIAMISEMMASRGKGLNQIASQYCDLLDWLQKQNLMDAHNLKPIIDGRRLLKEVGKSPGPWTKNAVRTLLKWQFRNPGITDPTEGIKEVVDRYREGS